MILEQNKTYEFAIKWIEKFETKNIDYVELVEDFMADDCETLGFKMIVAMPLKRSMVRRFMIRTIILLRLPRIFQWL